MLEIPVLERQRERCDEQRREEQGRAEQSCCSSRNLPIADPQDRSAKKQGQLQNEQQRVHGRRHSEHGADCDSPSSGVRLSKPARG